MYLAFHYPFFGSATVDARAIECPYCPRGLEHGTNDWQDKPIAECNPGDRFRCNRCGGEITIQWGLVEPDHLSTWISSEHCPHYLCQLKYQQLCEEQGWKPFSEPRTSRIEQNH